MNSLLLIILCSLLRTVITVDLMAYKNDTIDEYHENNGKSKVLSRRKRFLIFPDGSSFQLVFLYQTPVLIPIGDIFLFAETAGLAWLLPTDPTIFHTLKEYERPLRRSDVVKTINYLDEDGRLIAKVPYKRKLIITPVLGKRSIDDHLVSPIKEKPKINRKMMHRNHFKTGHLKIHSLDKNSKEFHRKNRLELYQKFEKLLITMGRDGRQCVLYKLCEAAQRAPRQGTFLQEFLRAVFTLPKGTEFNKEEHREYDKAHVANVDCVARYPGCEEVHESNLK
ncbi:uncharacterized protein LOC126912945 [Spodoptera frugiperda]|uniref:Uncharacterized protein LOC126912945 n=1 Tax=Spodoptera frugiperda TaxID=7108 RepID=A0A9R0EDU6_SPOFR|nr:uncharacterized protein LOC126912945 [Spodoptera frugiperda]